MHFSIKLQKNCFYPSALLLKMNDLVISLLLCRIRKDNILPFTINADYSICSVFLYSQRMGENVTY